jgi:DNA repair protein RadC
MRGAIENMARRTTSADDERSERYERLMEALLSRHCFHKAEICEALKDEKKVFVGRAIAELERDGYLVMEGPKTNLRYCWSSKRERLDVGRWIESRVYTPTVKRSPSRDRPRERLLREGPSQLKISELLAILIRSGVPGESATQAGERLAALFGDQLEKLSLRSRGELKRISRALGETAYCQIIAALELGKRLAAQLPAESAPREKIANARDALSFCERHFARMAREADKEELHVVLLDGKHRVIKTERVTVGLLNESLAHPREVLKPAIRESAHAVILVHNHPSGDPTPSQDDKAMTKGLKTAAETLGIRIIDHIIVGRDRLLSMVDERIL